jgi:hypothetical protein
MVYIKEGDVIGVNDLNVLAVVQNVVGTGEYKLLVLMVANRLLSKSHNYDYKFMEI